MVRFETDLTDAELVEPHLPPVAAGSACEDGREVFNAVHPWDASGVRYRLVFLRIPRSRDTIAAMVEEWGQLLDGS